MITRDQLAHIPNVNLEKPATEAEIAHAEELIGCTFPKDYKDLLACSDGLFVGGAYSLNLYSTNYLQERNQTYEVAEYAPPGWVLIGDDGGGNGIFLDCSSSQGTLYRAGLGSMSR